MFSRRAFPRTTQERRRSDREKERQQRTERKMKNDLFEVYQLFVGRKQINDLSSASSDSDLSLRRTTYTHTHNLIYGHLSVLSVSNRARSVNTWNAEEPHMRQMRQMTNNYALIQIYFSFSFSVFAPISLRFSLHFCFT